MATLEEFLLARIAEDEAAARAASPAPWSYPGIESVAGGTLYDETRRIVDVVYEQPADHDGRIVRHLLVPEADANGAHIARNDPSRVLAECAAKRQIVREVEATRRSTDAAPGGTVRLTIGYGLDAILRALALPYADHPDYNEAWRT